MILHACLLYIYMDWNLQINLPDYFYPMAILSCVCVCVCVLAGISIHWYFVLNYNCSCFSYQVRKFPSQVQYFLGIFLWGLSILLSLSDLIIRFRRSIKNYFLMYLSNIISASTFFPLSPKASAQPFLSTKWCSPADV